MKTSLRFVICFLISLIGAKLIVPAIDPLVILGLSGTIHLLLELEQLRKDMDHK